MSVWIICDGDPDCDNHTELDSIGAHDLCLEHMPDGWAGTPTNAHCPDHTHLHVPF